MRYVNVGLYKQGIRLVLVGCVLNGHLSKSSFKPLAVKNKISKTTINIILPCIGTL